MIGVLFRFVIYAAVFAGCVATLYGIVEAQNKLKDAEKKVGAGDLSSCPLFADADKPGNQGWCKYIEFSAAAQLALAVLMAVVLVVRLVHKKGNIQFASVPAMLEVLIMIPASIVAVSGGSIVTSGLLITCNNGKDYIKKTYPSYNGNCKDTFDIFFPENMYNLLFTAEIGMWVTCIWIVHLIASAWGMHLWRKHKGHVSSTQMFAPGQTESYKSMNDDLSI